VGRFPDGAPHDFEILSVMNDQSSEHIDELLAQFGPKRKLAFTPLRPHTELIRGLRQRGASFATVLEVLKHQGVETSHTSVRSFCVTLLGEQKRETSKSKRRKGSPPLSAIPSQDGRSKSDSNAKSPASSAPAQTDTKSLIVNPALPKRTPGPRIANVEFIEEPKI
jgi:hypothetical protein